MEQGNNSMAIPTDRLTAETVAYPAYVELALSREASPSEPDGELSVVTFLIEASALLREGLRRILSETAYSPVAHASCLEEIGSVQAYQGSTAIFILDAAQDHSESCRQARALKEEDPAARVVMLVEEYNFWRVLAAFNSGADAYLMKSVSCEVLLKTLDMVLLGETIFPARALGSFRDRGASIAIGDVEDLSSRELAIIRCLVEGDPNKIIARKLSIAEATVKVHIKAILRKIGVRNRTQAAVWGMRYLLPGDDNPAREMKAAG